jgi:outer membrane lipoprotein SlyB
MIRSPFLWTALVAALALSACATQPPSGPSIMVLPGSNKNFDQFRFDESECRQYASNQVGTTAEDASVDSGVRSAALGTVVGAAAGALIGGRSGAAVGAGAGLLVGSTSGAGAAGASARTVQQRYDIAYAQCMYAKGHQVPAAGARRQSGPYSAPPPPPPGTPPPPPPR